MAGDVDSAMKEIGIRIREKRKERGMSQKTLAIQADISYTHLSAIEKGQHNIRLDTLFRIAYALEVSWAELQPEALDPFGTVSPEYLQLFAMFQSLPKDKEKMMIEMVTAQIGSLKK